MPWLIVKDGPQRGKEFFIEPKETILGRDQRCEITLTDDRVSRRHARIVFLDNEYLLEDLDSCNGIMINGVPCTSRKLQEGDEILIGRELMCFTHRKSQRTPAALSDEKAHLAMARSVEGDPTTQFFSGYRSSFYLTQLFHLSDVLLSTKNVRSLATRVLEVLTSVLEADSGAFFLGADVDSLSTVTSVGKENKVLASRTLLAQALNKRKAIHFRLHKAHDVSNSESIYQASITSALTIPLDSPKGIIGILYLDRRGERRYFSETDLEFAAVAAREVALALLNTMERESVLEENIGLSQALLGKFRMIGDSPAIRQLGEELAKTGPTKLSVLITGESGTGKELAARALHALSPRKARPFIAVNCAAITGNLLESELFGHERGAFTGAVATRKGLVAMADGGTLFLDEIGDMSLECQAAILRFIETGEFRRVGGTKSLSVDVRIVAATHEDLSIAIKEKRFRQDLFYRLRGVEIALPPLRERRSDIPLLVAHFTSAMGRDKAFSPEAMRALQEYSWPGNIRELRNVVERLTILVTQREIEYSHLPPEIRNCGTQDQSEPLMTLAELERQHIMKALKMTGGNRTKAASLLGVTRKTLYNKIRSYGLA